MLTVLIFLIIFLPLIILFAVFYFTGIIFLLPGSLIHKAREKMKKEEPPIEYEIIEDDEEKLP